MGFRDSISDRIKSLFGDTAIKAPNDVDKEPYAYPNLTNIPKYNADKITRLIFNRLANDVARFTYAHTYDTIDPTTEALHTYEVTDDTLFRRFKIDANQDETFTQLIRKAMLLMLNNSKVAIIPTRFKEPTITGGSLSIYELRIGLVLQEYPSSLRLKAYNSDTGMDEEVVLQKRFCAIMQNPLENISTNNYTLDLLRSALKTLEHEVTSLSANSVKGFIEFPYTTKQEIRKSQAQKRLEEIDGNMKSASHGLAYLDAGEKFTQLNRDITSGLLDNVKYLTDQLFQSYGLTPALLNGTATETEIRLYQYNYIMPIVDMITEELTRKLLSRYDIQNGHRISAYSNPLELMSAQVASTVADSFTRNAILTPNEIRQLIHYRPATDVHADKLYNRNIGTTKNQVGGNTDGLTEQV